MRCNCNKCQMGGSVPIPPPTPFPLFPTLTSANKMAMACECVKHATIVTSDSPIRCQYTDQPHVFDTPDDTLKLEPTPGTPPIKVMEEGGFFIEKHPDNNKAYDPHDSWLAHYCPKMHWKVYLDEEFMMKHGQCVHCHQTVPPGLIALWQMHNWEYLQTGGSTAHAPDGDSSC